MAESRLPDIVHLDMAHALPLPCPSFSLDFVGEANDPQQQAECSQILAKAPVIAELLASVNVDYLKVREFECKGEGPYAHPASTLMEAVQSSRAEAFSVPHSSRVWQLDHQRQAQPLGVSGTPVTLEGSRVLQMSRQPPVQKEAEEGKHVGLEGDIAGSLIIKRRRTSMKHILHHSIQNNNVKAEKIGLLAVFDRFFDKFERLHEDGPESDGKFLSAHEFTSILDAMATNSAEVLALPKESLSKLLQLLHVSIDATKCCPLLASNWMETGAVERVFASLEAIHVALSLMTHPGMSKQVLNEEIIERMVWVTKQQVFQTVFPFYDASFKASQGGTEDDGDDVNLGKRSRNTGKSVTASGKKIVSAVQDKICSIYQQLGELVEITRLQDKVVFQLMKMTLTSFTVDNVQLLQLKSMFLLCKIFRAYPEHRNMVLDEVSQNLWKLSTGKNIPRCYHLPEEGHIQMMSALVLNLLQSAIELPDEVKKERTDDTVTKTQKSEKLRKGKKTTKDDNISGADGEAKDIPPIEGAQVNFSGLEQAIEAAMHFWKVVLDRWALPKSQDSPDVKAIIENLVHDFLQTLGLPEYPVSSLMIQILSMCLDTSNGLKSESMPTRCMAIDLLGIIASRLKSETLAAAKDSMWPLEHMDSSAMNLNCPLCTVILEGRSALSCSGCQQAFHKVCCGFQEDEDVPQFWKCILCATRDSLAEAGLEGDELDTAVLRQLIMTYLSSNLTDERLLWAKCFLVAMWFQEDRKISQNLRVFADMQTLAKMNLSCQLPSREVATRVFRRLGVLKPLARSFDAILSRLLGCVSDKPTTRARAMKALSMVLEVDPSVLGDERVKSVVEERFMDTSISVREAAIDLVGKHIISFPEMALKYYEPIVERIMDTGVSVRKRVIKIIKELCVTHHDFPKRADGLGRIFARWNDDEPSIKELVLKTFQEVLFDVDVMEEINGDGIPQSVAEATKQVVDIIKSHKCSQAVGEIVRTILTSDESSKLHLNAVNKERVKIRCEQICKCLLECILQAEESTSEDIAALPYVQVLQAFCEVNPLLCVPHNDPSRVALTLKPYLTFQQPEVSCTDEARMKSGRMLESISVIMTSILPHLRRPPQSFQDELERDLVLLITKHTFLTVVHSCIKCLCTLRETSPRPVRSFEGLVQRFYRILSTPGQNKHMAMRSLFVLGLLVRYCNPSPSRLVVQDVPLSGIIATFKEYAASEDLSLKVKAIQGLGFVFITCPEEMVEQSSSQLLEDSLKQAAPDRVQIQLLKNLMEYLQDAEEKMMTENRKSKVTPAGDGEQAVPSAAGAGDTNVCSGVIQQHWDSILNLLLNDNAEVRQTALKFVEVVLRQGLVLPVTCVPHLIALCVDETDVLSKVSQRLLDLIHERWGDKYKFVENRFCDGLKLSFTWLKRKPPEAAPSSQTGFTSRYMEVTPRVKSGIGCVYKIIRSSRQSRNSILLSIVKRFDYVDSAPLDLSFLAYCADLLSSFPFGLPDEPMFIIFQISKLVHIRGGSLQSSLKAALTGKSVLAGAAQEAYNQLAEEKERRTGEAYKLLGEDEEEQSTLEESQSSQPDIVLPTGSSELFERIKEDCMFAMSLSLLLTLKGWLKATFSLSDSKCLAYNPAEALRQGDILVTREMGDFRLKDLPLCQTESMRDVVLQYQVFKKLLKRDSVGDYAGIATPMKKKRHSLPNSLTHAGEQVEANVDDTSVPRSKRRRSAPLNTKMEIQETEDRTNEDEDYEVEVGKKRKRALKPQKRRQVG